MQDTRAEVLDALDAGPTSGPDLADRLDISRAAVWKHVEALREAGFDVASRDDGYVLEGVPDYGSEAIEFGLEAPFEIEYHDTIDSTNSRGRELAQAGREDVVVLADAQTGGKGRLDREWASPPGGVWLSLVLRPDIPTASAPVFTLAAAVATTDAVRDLGAEAGIKWPNDVLVGEKKVAGILTEMSGEMDRVSWIVVGIGINADVDGESVPANATTLRELVDSVDRRRLVQTLLERFDELRQDPSAVLPAWRERTVTLGRRVRVETPSETIVGTAVDVEFPGALVVETDSGRRVVSAGDCEHLRPL